MKKRYIAAGVVLATALVGQTASAKTLEDILKEKGVITQAEYKEVTKIKPIDYKLGKGFTFTSADEKFQLSVGGRLQFRYVFTDNEVAQDTSQFDVARARLIFGGYAYSKNLTYAFEIDGRALSDSAKQKQGLVQAWMNYKFINEAEIRLGQFKDVFGRQEVISDGSLEFVERSPVANAFRHSYDIGAMLSGKIADGLAYYNVGVYGGAGQTNTRNANDNAFFARAAVNPLGEMAYSEGDLGVSEKPLVSFGANYLRNTLNKPTATTVDSTASYVSGTTGWVGTSFGIANDKIDVDEYGFDAAFKWMGFSLQGEYLLGQGEIQRTGQLKRGHGFYSQASYMIIPEKLQLAIRYSYLDPNRDAANDNRTEQIGAISYYFNRHNLKVQADVGKIHDQALANKDVMQYRVQAQIVF